MKDPLFRKKSIPSLLLITVCLLLTGCSHKQEHHSAGVKHGFDDIEHWVRMFEDPERDAWQRPAEVIEAMDLQPGNVVADIGAGTGYFTRRFAVAVGPTGKAFGLDIEPGMVDYMNEDARKLNLPNYEARVVKPDDPELPPKSVDLVFLCNTYHHLENRTEYFKKVAQSLKTNGRVVNVDFYKNSDFGPPREHKLAREVVIEEMKAAGFRLVQSHDFLPQQYILEFRL